jgi:hypothetical protein
MAIVGIETVLHGVEDRALSTRFFEDFGLGPTDRSDTDDPDDTWIPPAWEVRLDKEFGPMPTGSRG